MAMEELKLRLNEIGTYLSEGEIWHRKTANELRKLPNKRGFARWHEKESEYDQCEHLKLDKLIRDHLRYAPMVDIAYVSKAESYTISDMAGFKQHFQAWIARETAFLASLNAAIEHARDVDIALYHCLCSLAKEVKNEEMRASWVYAGLEETQWSTHDVRVVSRWLHSYFEEKYDGGTIDFNIG